jgi:hypothetical protein
MAIQSIGALVQVGDVAGNHLFMTTCKVPIRKMDLVREIDESSQEIWTGAKTLNDPWHLRCSGSGANKGICLLKVAASLVLLHDSDLRCGSGIRELRTSRREFCFLAQSNLAYWIGSQCLLKAQHCRRYLSPHNLCCESLSQILDTVCKGLRRLVSCWSLVDLQVF